MKHILQDVKELKTGSRELRKFGLLVGGVFAAIGLFQLARHKPIYPWFLTPGIVLILLGAIAPKVLKQVYLVWMSLAMVLGFVVSNVLLILLFFLAILPIGLVARLAGKDFLGLKLIPQTESYWIRRDPKARIPEDYERQF
jgi:hypothetical protein